MKNYIYILLLLIVSCTPPSPEELAEKAAFDSVAYVNRPFAVGEKVLIYPDSEEVVVAGRSCPCSGQIRYTLSDSKGRSWDTAKEGIIGRAADKTFKKNDDSYMSYSRYPHVTSDTANGELQVKQSKPRPKPIPASPAPVTLCAGHINPTDTIFVTADKVYLEFSDNSLEDDDQATVFVGSSMLLECGELFNEGMMVPLRVQGEERITWCACNQGTQSINTGEVSITSGGRTEVFPVRLLTGESMTILIVKR